MKTAPSTPAFPAQDLRAAARFDTVMALEVEGIEAWTRNISATGVYFETEAQPPLGALLNLSLAFTRGGRKHWLLCEGKVVRVSPKNDRVGVAARLLTPFFAPAEEHPAAAGPLR
jgi:hypothetical protein